MACIGVTMISPLVVKLLAKMTMEDGSIGSNLRALASGTSMTQINQERMRLLIGVTEDIYTVMIKIVVALVKDMI